MDAVDAGSHRRRMDQYFPEKKKRLSKCKENSPNRRSSIEDISPHKKGCLDNFIISSKSPVSSSNAAVEGRSRVDSNSSTKISLCSRIEEKELKQCQLTTVQSSSKNDSFQETSTEQQKNGNAVQMTQFANDFLSICLSAKATEAIQDPNVGEEIGEKKRELDNMDHVEPASKRRHVISKPLREKISAADVGLIKFDTPVKEDIRGKEKDFATPDQAIIQVCTARRSKPPCTPRTQKEVKRTPVGINHWIQGKFSSPGDAFWDEAIEVTNDLLADYCAEPNQQCQQTHAECSNGADRRSEIGLETHADNDECNRKGGSPMPIRHFDFGSQSNGGGQAKSQKDAVQPVISTTSDRILLREWLPSELCETYAKKGLKQLYPWQVDCLQLEGVLEGRSLVYSASTSAGKSLVAEILMLKRVLLGKKAILVLPYVALCAEKAEHLESLLEPIGKRVRSFFGTQGGVSLPPDTSIAVCTIEKANSLVNKLLEEGRLSEIAVIVIDELHMVGDKDRGYLLELMLTKLRYAAGKGENMGTPDPGTSLQIIGMSATMSNVAAVAAWLQASLYQTNFRPVPLDEFVKVGGIIYDRNFETVRKLREGSDLGGKDPDHVVELCHEVVREGHSALLFCSSRRACETSARHVAKFLPKFSVSSKNTPGGFKDGNEAVEELRKCPAGLDPVLAETLPAGVAYHHAGLTAEEREVVEACYRQGVVRVLAATSTLAAGVNLPARRVIFRQPKVGCDFLDGTRYRQMAGRAGRAGIDTKGESVLICKPEEVNRMLPVLKEGCQPLCSCLAEDKNGMMRALLEVVAGGIVQTSHDVNRYVRCTLLSSTKPFEDVVKSAQDSLRWLCQKRLLEWDHALQMYKTTPLGRAAFGSSLSPEESLVVFEDLARARESFVLASDLHLVYEVTPIYVDLEPDWSLYYKRFVELTHVDQAVGNRVGVMEAFLMRMAHGAPVQRNRSAKSSKSPTLKTNEHLPMEQILRVCRRFYVALMLSQLVQEVPLMDVCSNFNVPRGTVQALQDSSGRFAAMVTSFCERLGWHDLEGLISKFQNRVSFGVRAEIVSLTEIPFVKAARARSLYKSGLRTVQAVAEASISEIISALSDASSKDTTGQQWMQAAAARKIKNGARRIVLDKAEEARKAAFSAFQALGVIAPQSLSQPITVNIREEEEGPADKSEVKIHQSREPLQNIDKEKDKHSDKENQERNLSSAGGSISFGGSIIIQDTSVQPAPPVVNAQLTDKGPVDVSKIVPGGFEAFLELWEAVEVFYFDLHYADGAVFEIEGVAICWLNSPVYYIGISNCTDATIRWGKLSSMFCKKTVRKVCWDFKPQLQALDNPGFVSEDSTPKVADIFQKSVQKIHKLSALHIGELFIDMRVAAWLLWPDEESDPNTSLEAMVKKRLPGDVAAAASRAGRWTNQMGRVAHNGCCRRAAHIRGLYSALWKLIASERLGDVLLRLEMPLVVVLSDMEKWAIGVNLKACFDARELLQSKIKKLESQAHVVAGMQFSLSLPADVADLLYRHLKLPVPPGCKGKQHPSTDKQALDFLRDRHPVVNIIKEHRSLSKLLHSTVGAVISSSKRLIHEKESYGIHGKWLHTSTGTGRLSMEDPNLQCVEHSISFSLEDKHTSELKHIEVNAREFFVPTQEGWTFISADYSQIELRLMAHFSGDDALIALLNQPSGDVFRMMAAQWTGQSEANVSDKQREQTKRLVYGILYGMGVNTLAERLECSVKEAGNYHDQFKTAFPGVGAWLQQTVNSCRQKGYIETLGGRKRYLEKINNLKRGEQAKAERQSVNSICQGSAADLIKMAMINLHSALTGSSSKTTLMRDDDVVQHSMLKGRCRLLLQIHDELLLEVDNCILREASMIIRSCMQDVASLRVPLIVKLNAGPSWGKLQAVNLD